MGESALPSCRRREYRPMDYGPHTNLRSFSRILLRCGGSTLELFKTRLSKIYNQLPEGVYLPEM